MGKLQTTLRADPTARQISASDPSERVRVKVVQLPGSRLFDGLAEQPGKLPDAALHLRSRAEKQRLICGF